MRGPSPNSISGRWCWCQGSWEGGGGEGGAGGLGQGGGGHRGEECSGIASHRVRKEDLIWTVAKGFLSSSCISTIYLSHPHLQVESLITEVQNIIGQTRETGAQCRELGDKVKKADPTLVGGGSSYREEIN